MISKSPPPSQEDTKEVFEEITSEGLGSGLEAERIEPGDGEIGAPFDPAKIDVITQTRTVALLLTRLKEGELDLAPDFQRRGNLWNASRKSALIESMLLRIPIPSLYVSEDAEGDYAVVDGLQRMCAIAHFVDVPSLNKAAGEKLDSLRLKGLQSLKEYENRTFAELPRPLQRRINETELTLHVIRASTPPEVKFNIFSRINQGGLPLTSQEIRNAISPGLWRDHVRRMATSTIFLNATEGKIKAERMEDFELVLRFVAHYSLDKSELRPTEQNLDDFLNDFVVKRCSRWSEAQWSDVVEAFERALLAAPKIFGRIAFRKHSFPNEPRRPINRGLFESESVAIARRSVAEIRLLQSKQAEIAKLFHNYLQNDAEFANSLLYATGRGLASNKRLEIFRKIFDEALHA